MLRLTQKTTTLEGKNIAYVEALIVNGDYDYRVTFDKNTKKRANTWFRSLGFRIGQIDDLKSVPPKVVEI